ncbi:MAG: site-specific DNA-methyltransferase [Endomicrobium sp.]|nr:site-specific DNA-methyltransferase [Endomicrobium sp.]
MTELGGKSIDLVFTDPPYYDAVEKLNYHKQRSVTKLGVKTRSYKKFNNWKVPKNNVYQELLRISKEQIICGINYFSDFVDVPSGRIIWDKKRSGRLPFSDAEIASVSMIETVKMYRFRWDGMLQEDMKNKENKFHPTQKPVKLMCDILRDFSKDGQTVFDGYAGSGSFAIACERLGLSYIGCEIEEYYFDKACRRLENELKQPKLNLIQNQIKADQIQLNI